MKPLPRAGRRPALILLDTNILLRYACVADPALATVDAAITTLHARGEPLCVVPQNIYEFWAVATRPTDCQRARPDGRRMSSCRSHGSNASSASSRTCRRCSTNGNRWSSSTPVPVVRRSTPGSSPPCRPTASSGSSRSTGPTSLDFPGIVGWVQRIAGPPRVPRPARSVRPRLRLTHPTLLHSEPETAEMEQGTNVSPPPSSPPLARRIVLGVVRWAVVLVGLLIAILAYIVGLLPMILQVAVDGGHIWRVRHPAGRRLPRQADAYAPWRRLLDPALRPARLQAVNRALFWAAAGLMLIWILPAALIGPDDYRGLAVLIAVVTVVDVVLALAPTGRAVRPAWNVLPLLGWLFLGVEALRILGGPPGPAVELAAPFDGEWAVGQGSRSALVNHHYPVRGQSHAHSTWSSSMVVALPGDYRNGWSPTRPSTPSCARRRTGGSSARRMVAPTWPWARPTPSLRWGITS